MSDTRNSENAGTGSEKGGEVQPDDGWGNDSAWAQEGDWGQASALYSSNNEGFDRGWSDERETIHTQQRSTEPESNRVPPQRQAVQSSPNREALAVAKPPGTRSNARRAIEGHESDDEALDIDAHDNEHFPPRRRGRAFLAFLFVLVLLAAGVLFVARWYQMQVTPSGSQGPKVTITIPTSTSTAGIGKILHTNKVIGNPRLFRFYAQYKGKGGFEAGQYEFATNSSFDQALSILTKGASVPDQNKVTIPEGLRIEQTVDRLMVRLPGRSRDLFLEAATNGKIRSAFSPTGQSTLEGFLFPETYTFNLSDDESTVVSRMVETFDQIAEGVALSKSQEKVGLSTYDTLIVASLVEREAKLDSDRAKIARVIYNRLKNDTALQIDATLVYALGGVDRILLEDLKKDGPYNTYTRKGLPPTPIASPGKASLEAALNPEKGDWLYYVVTGTDGSHSFATTFKEHKANIKLAKERGLR